MSHLPADFYRKLEDGLIVGRAYPATGCAPLGPPPIQAIVGAGLPTAANMPDAHSEMLRLLDLDPATYRTDGGRLNLLRIRAALAERKTPNARGNAPDTARTD